MSTKISSGPRGTTYKERGGVESSTMKTKGNPSPDFSIDHPNATEVIVKSRGGFTIEKIGVEIEILRSTWATTGPTKGARTGIEEWRREKENSFWLLLQSAMIWLNLLNTDYSIMCNLYIWIWLAKLVNICMKHHI